MSSGIHSYYEKLTKREKAAVDWLFDTVNDSSLFHQLGSKNIRIQGDDRCERAVNAIAQWVIESRKPRAPRLKKQVSVSQSIDEDLYEPMIQALYNAFPSIIIRIRDRSGKHYLTITAQNAWTPVRAMIERFYPDAHVTSGSWNTTKSFEVTVRLNPTEE